MSFPSIKPFRLGLILVLAIFIQTVSAQVDWRPVSPEELAQKAPKVEPGADAEAIFWEVRLDDKKSSKMTYSHYVRVKIFTERGRERFSKFDIPFLKGKKVENIAARVIKPDGSIVELKPSDIFERDIITVRKVKVKAKSFAVPGIEPGVIVEYQYDELIKGDSASGERLIFQRDIPIQRVTYWVRPFPNMSLSFNPYNMPAMDFTKENKGFYVGNLYDVPAFREEPYMPPDDEVKKWVYLRYQGIGTLFQWGLLSSRYADLMKALTKPSKEIKAKAAELTAGAATDDEKLRRLYTFVQREIRNLSFDRSLTEEQRENIKVKDADDALKNRAGDSMFIDLLFASLARAAGYEVRLAVSGDRSDNFFTPEKYPFPSFIQPACIAVRVGNDFKYFNPATPYVPYGYLLWNEEDTTAMIVGESNYAWQVLPLSDHAASPVKRWARLRLNEDGSVDGPVRFEYGGHQAIARRREGFFESENKRLEDFKEEFKRRVSAAEIENLIIENFDDNSKPLVYSFNVKIPNYAQKTGKRMFLQPGFFEYGSTPAFSSAERTHSIYFPYPWSENDDVEIEYPKSLELDNADAPADVQDPSRIGSLKIVIRVDQANSKLLYKRDFYFGGGGNILFTKNVYTPLKNLFDFFHKADTHTITLRQKSGS